MHQQSLIAGCLILLSSIFISQAQAQAQLCPPAIQIDRQPQVFITSDISNEPDDTMSFVRLLLHSDQYNITGMIAVTSYWQNASVYPDQILGTVRAFGEVRDNLNTHSAGEFPTQDYLESVVKAGHPVYGTAAIGQSSLSSGAQHFIAVVDGLVDDDILHCQAWGGTNLFGEALSHIRTIRTSHDVDKFVAKLRLYAISDQDNVGPWLRANFPTLPFIVSLHGFNQYGLATWSGISGEQFYGFDHGGPDTNLVTNEYVSRNFQIGPLGSLYPDIAFIMEGDSPCILHTMQNGLNGGPVDHPEWGGWGGRYILLDPSRQTMVYSDTIDLVIGQNNQTFRSNQATIWRWRQAFQDEMSARVQWSIQSNYSAGSHPPIVSVNGSCGSEPLIIDVSPEQKVTLDASRTYDPDANLTGRGPLRFNWFHYSEITSNQAKLNFTLSAGGQIAVTELPTAERACAARRALQAPTGVQVCQQYHVILEVTGSGQPPIRRYKRIILKVHHDSSDTEDARRKRDEL